MQIFLLPLLLVRSTLSLSLSLSLMANTLSLCNGGSPSLSFSCFFFSFLFLCFTSQTGTHSSFAPIFHFSYFFKHTILMNRWILSKIYPTVHNANGMVPFAFWGGTASAPHIYIYIYIFFLIRFFPYWGVFIEFKKRIN